MYGLFFFKIKSLVDYDVTFRLLATPPPFPFLPVSLTYHSAISAPKATTATYKTKMELGGGPRIRVVIWYIPAITGITWPVASVDDGGGGGGWGWGWEETRPGFVWISKVRWYLRSAEGQLNTATRIIQIHCICRAVHKRDKTNLSGTKVSHTTTVLFSLTHSSSSSSSSSPLLEPDQSTLANTFTAIVFIQRIGFRWAPSIDRSTYRAR